MKVLAYVFSMMGESSHTLDITKKYVEALKEQIDEEIEFEYITSNHMHIDYCRGCNNCFAGRHCPLSNDDMPMLKQKIEECDLWIFASPVYFANVSGICKSFIDRCSDYSHHMPLPGKPVVNIATASKEQCVETIDIMNRFTGQLGCLTFASLGISNNYLKAQMNEMIQKAAKDTAYYLQHPLEVKHEQQSLLYTYFLNLYKRKLVLQKIFKTVTPCETDKYEEALLPYETFDEYVSREK